jgi:hypothetical protein
VSITCSACWREDVLDMQRGIMTLEWLRRSWRELDPADDATTRLRP